MGETNLMCILILTRMCSDGANDDRRFVKRNKQNTFTTCVTTRYLFKFWEISDIISETVQDRDIVTMED